MVTDGDLERKSNEELFSMYHSSTDGLQKEVGDSIVLKNMPLVYYLARRLIPQLETDYANDLDDVIQQGTIGLILARDRL